MSLQTRLADLVAAVGADIKELRRPSTAVNAGVTSVTSGASLTPAASTRHSSFYVTALAVAATINAPSGTAIEGDRLLVRFEDNGTARALTWNAIYRPIGLALPTTTTPGKTLYIGIVYNAIDTRWDVIAIQQEA